MPECVFDSAKQRDGTYVLRCAGDIVRVAGSPDFHRVCDCAAAGIAAGPGRELTSLLAELGLTDSITDCGCEQRAHAMNVWGTDGCRARREQLIDWLKGSAKQAGWLKKLKAAAMALRPGATFRPDPLDPFGSLVDEAIRRSTTS